MSAQRTIPLNKDEVMQLVNLVYRNPVLYSKATNANTNQLKEAAWLKITDSFNSSGRSPRKPEQLRFTWETVKTAVRNRRQMRRQNVDRQFKVSIIDKNRAIAEYYTAKRKNEEEIAGLKKRMLVLAIERIVKRERVS